MIYGKTFTGRGQLESRRPKFAPAGKMLVFDESDGVRVLADASSPPLGA